MASAAADPTIRRQVVAAARRVIATDAHAPVARIAAEAGVSRATLYRHFGSRDGLLAIIDRQAPPTARARILDAAQELLVGTSLAELSMDDLARAAGVSRGTLYRHIPGKPALLRAMIETYSPFRAMHGVLADHGDDEPAVVLPLLARAVLGAADGRIGLMRAVLNEATSGSPATVAGVQPVLGPALGALASYMSRQMAAGRLRQMNPLLAIQAFIGPIYFHLTTRPVLGEIVDVRLDVDEAVDELVKATLEGLTP
jgi:AcrR family transcriptional regulator